VGISGELQKQLLGGVALIRGSTGIGCALGEGEPGCAVQETVDGRRVESYRKLQREQEMMERSAATRERRRMAKTGRRVYNRRDAW